MNQDNQCLTKICQDNDKNIIMGESDLNKLSKTINKPIDYMNRIFRKIFPKKKKLKRKII